MTNEPGARIYLAPSSPQIRCGWLGGVDFDPPREGPDDISTLGSLHLPGLLPLGAPGALDVM